MTLRLRHLRLRAMTPAGLYGTDIPFEPGLNVIWADNTKGKSTCMQGMLYALGLEKMLSPRREIPLPHAMTSFLKNDDDTIESILESNVSLELQNSAGNVITVHRAIRHPITDNRLITVDFGPVLSESAPPLRRKNFFVLDSGAAQREDGFHFFLEDFLGWKLPIVRRYDGPDSKLYLETVFPLFWVEQKVGWSAIPAAIPTYMKIREVQKRAVEFIMDLDVHRIEIERQRLQDQIDQNARAWRVLIDELDRNAQRVGGKIESIPQHPTIILDQISIGHVLISNGSEWLPLRDLLHQLRNRVSQLADSSVPLVGELAESLMVELDEVNVQIENINRSRIELYKLKQLKTADIGSLERRIKSLNEDMLKNRDVQRIQRYSGSAEILTPALCPTCEQSLSDSLLPQNVITSVMPIDENIEYLRSQLKMFENILKRENHKMDEIGLEQARINQNLRNLYRRVRTIRADLTTSSDKPSAVAIEERVRTETRVNELELVQTIFEDIVEKMQDLGENLKYLLEEKSKLPSKKMSEEDEEKFVKLTKLLRRLAEEFGFSTFDPDELMIAEDTYRPEKEGYEIGFETSASDAIRLKWAYQLGLLELSHWHKTNHPGMLLLDEPRQQSSSRVSFGKLLERAASYQRENQQIIVSTSEDLDTLDKILSQIKCNKKIIPGYVIKRIDPLF